MIQMPLWAQAVAWALFLCVIAYAIGFRLKNNRAIQDTMLDGIREEVKTLRSDVKELSEKLKTEREAWHKENSTIRREWGEEVSKLKRRISELSAEVSELLAKLRIGREQVRTMGAEPNF
jgi:predicted  nucleic acid-binding Zn-ribbon protein